MTCHHLLVVDGEAELCTTIQGWLEKSGQFRVSCALSGDQAFPLLGSDRPDLLLLDPKLPGAPGIELALQATERGIPIILTTGEAETEARLRRLGWPHLRKPVDLDHLLAECLATVAEAQRHLKTVSRSFERLLKNTDEIHSLTMSFRQLRQEVALTLAAAQRVRY